MKLNNPIRLKINIAITHNTFAVFVKDLSLSTKIIPIIAIAITISSIIPKESIASIIFN
jgi:hypothetical protein